MANLNTYLPYLNAFSQKENDKVLAELVMTANDLLDQENETNSDVLFEESSPFPSCTAPILMLDNELNSKIQLLNKNLRKVSYKVQS